MATQTTKPEPLPVDRSNGNSSADPEGRMTFIEHLGELRIRIIRSLWAAGIGIVVAYIISNQLITLLAAPLIYIPHDKAAAAVDGATTVVTSSRGEAIPWVVLNPLEPMLVKMKIAAWAGLLFALPFILHQIRAFIFPGLNDREKKAITICISGCTGLAIAGVALAYWGVFPFVLPYLASFAPDFVEFSFRMNETLSLLLKCFLGFAAAFQFPMVVLALVYMDILSPDTLKAYRKMAIVGLFALAMVLTPPDPFSMLVMGMPLVLLYEVSIWMSYMIVRLKKRRAAEAGT